MKHRVATMSVLLVLGAVVLLTPMPARAQEVGDVAEFADKALQEYVQKVVTPRNVGGLGFDSVDQAKMGELGDPLEVTMIGLRDLKAYDPDQPADSIVKGADAYWFPVTVEDETRAGLEIVKIEGELVAGQFGSSKTAMEVSKATGMLPEILGGRQPDKVTLLRVPVLRASFLRAEGADGDVLVPAMVHPERLGIEEGKAYPAAELLAKLSDLAQEIDENKLQ